MFKQTTAKTSALHFSTLFIINIMLLHMCPEREREGKRERKQYIFYVFQLSQNFETKKQKIKTFPSGNVDRCLKCEAAFSFNYLQSSSHPGNGGRCSRYRNSSRGPMRQGASNTGVMMQRRVKDGAQQEHPAAKRAPVSSPMRSARPFDRGGPTRLSSTDAMWPQGDSVVPPDAKWIPDCGGRAPLALHI